MRKVQETEVVRIAPAQTVAPLVLQSVRALEELMQEAEEARLAEETVRRQQERKLASQQRREVYGLD